MLAFELQTRFVEGREVSERVSPKKVLRDADLIGSLVRSVHDLDDVYKVIGESIEAARGVLSSTFDEMASRLRFHYDGGLEEVLFIVEHDFIRGWTVFEERVLNYVTADFYGIGANVRRTLDFLNASVPLTQAERREDVWWGVRSTLEGRLRLIHDARANVTEADRAYRTGDPLLTYKATIDRRYDESFISVRLLKVGTRRREEYFTALLKGIDEMEAGLMQMLDIGWSYVHNGTLTPTSLTSSINLYIKGCKAYNYRLFLFKDRIVYKPKETMEGRIDTFRRLEDDLQTSVSNVEGLLDTVETLLANVSHSWTSIHDVARASRDYQLLEGVNKTSLAEKATHAVMQNVLRLLHIKLGELRARGTDLDDAWMRLSAATAAIWRNMLGEYTTHSFYGMVHNDTVAFLNEPENRDFYYRIFAALLEVEEEEIRVLEPEEVVTLLNADFPTMDVEAKVNETSVLFERLRIRNHIGRHMGDKDDVFFHQYQRLQKSLETFLEGNEMNQKFYRENFMQLDVFMQELSYEEITQQNAYDLPKLLSDLGGSMGLFIGGSALSVFEFFDVIVHNVARHLLRR